MASAELSDSALAMTDPEQEAIKGLDDKVGRLGPGVDARVRNELQAVLASLRAEPPYAIGALLGLSRLSLWLTRSLLVLAGRKPSDNLLSCISRATGEGGEQRSLLPSELASYLHNIRIVSNKARHDVEAIALTNIHAEIALSQFLTVLEWFYCDYERQPHRLRSIYVTSAPATALQARKASLWTVPGSRLPNFIGRDQLLERLERGFAAEAACARPQAITGLGGVGKTQLAIEYAQRHLADYDVAWWVRAAEPATLAGDFIALARALEVHVTDQRDEQMLRAAAHNWLARNDRWLLVFDNVEHPRDLTGYLPRGRGHVLITSQNPNWRGVADRIPLDVLARADACTFLLRRTGQSDVTAATALAEALGDLPLALEQAGAYLEETEAPLAEYLAMFARREELLERGTPTEYPGTIATTWALAFDRIAETEAAPQLLRLCAFLDPDSIPIDLLAVKTSQLPSPLTDIVDDPIARNEVISLLRRFSLVERKGETLSLHRLVQAVTRKNLTAQDRRAWAARALQTVRAAFPQGPAPMDVRSWSDCERLLPHVLAVTEHGQGLSIEPEITSGLLNNLATYLQVRGRLHESRACFERALALADQTYGSEHPEVAALCNNLGLLLRDLRELGAARTYLERALTLNEAAFGPDDLRVTTNLNNLGRVLIDLGELPTAKVYLERCLASREATFGPDYPGLVLPLSNLGIVLRELGELQAARSCFERALAVPTGKEGLGTGFLTTAVRLSNLGTVLADLGELEAAQGYLEEAVTLEEEALGPEHPKVADHLNRLGTVLQKRGELEAARGCLERALSIHEAVLGPNHPDVASDLHNLGLILGDLGHLQTARTHLRRAVHINEAVLGSEHPTTRRVAQACEAM